MAFFFTGSAIIGILVISGRAFRDRKGDRKSLIVFWGFRSWELQLFVGVFLSSTANPQMFALAREHADRTGREAVMFSSILRAQVSLAWVIGPRSPTHWQWVLALR